MVHVATRIAGRRPNGLSTPGCRLHHRLLDGRRVTPKLQAAGSAPDLPYPPVASGSVGAVADVEARERAPWRWVASRFVA